MNVANLDRRNAEFWDELCGSGLAKMLGITANTPDSLRRFDEAFQSLYPYLANYIPKVELRGSSVLEIGLGYGTLGQMLAECGCNYHGLDIARGPAVMMRYRLDNIGKHRAPVSVGSALNIPYRSDSFDFVYTIGCLHHVGDLQGAIAEVYRVLRPGGKTIIMLYNRHSFRQLVQVPLVRLKELWKSRSIWNAVRLRAMYDTNASGEAAPHTDFVSPRGARRLLRRFTRVRIDKRNFDTYVLRRGRLIVRREKLLNNVARLLGLDLYITATK